MANGTGQSRVSPLDMARLLAANRQQVPLNVPGAGLVNASQSFLNAAMMRRAMNQEAAREREQAEQRRTAVSALARALSGTGGSPQVMATEPGPQVASTTAPSIVAQPGEGRNMSAILQAALAPGIPQGVQSAVLANVLRAPQQPDPFTLGPGQQRFDAAGNLIASVDPRQPEILNPDVQEARIRIARESRPQVTVEAPEMETEFQKEVGRQQAKDFQSMQGAAKAAVAQNQTLDQLEDAFENVYTGPGGEIAQSARRVGQLLGVEGLEEDIAAGEAGTAIANRMALQLRSTGEGGGMPGAMSDRDLAFLQSMTPSLATTPEGRKLMVGALRKVNQRNIDVARMARDYLRENGNMVGFEQELAARFANNPDASMFSDAEMMTLASTPGTAPNPPAAPTPPAIAPGARLRYDPASGQLVPQ